MAHSLLRLIPSIEELRRRPSVATLTAQYGADAVVAALRAVTQALRSSIAAGTWSDDNPERVVAELDSRLSSHLEDVFRPSLRKVLNATGVILHTNLGRAPLAAPAFDHIRQVAGGYSNLEYDVARGQRGSRHLHAEALLRRLTGAEAAVIVNNNAAAVLLVLSSLARGREVIISRGELVEIGGGFRVPDVMTQSGALLREVGTTNKTRVADYAAAITDRTALILKVHPSNFRLEGFVESARLSDLVALGRRFSIPIVYDLGSGNLTTTSELEPPVETAIRAGVDVLCFSGDKMLGGPQAGIILGKPPLVDTIRKHPLMRALRADKLTYAALEATLIEYAAGRAEHTVPAVAMLNVSHEELETRARRIVERLAGQKLSVSVTRGRSTVGGGSAPGSSIETPLIAISASTPAVNTLEERLRQGDPPVVARIDNDALLLDLRTISPSEDDTLIRALEAALKVD